MMFILKKTCNVFSISCDLSSTTCDVFQCLVMYTRTFCHVYSISCDVCSVIVFWVI